MFLSANELYRMFLSANELQPPLVLKPILTFPKGRNWLLFLIAVKQTSGRMDDRTSGQVDEQTSHPT